MDLLKGVKAEERTCRVCGRPCGLFEECDRCFLDRLESQFAELMDESGKPPLPDGLMDEVEWTDSPEGEASPPMPAPPAEAEPEAEAESEAEPEPEPAPQGQSKSKPPPSVPVVEAPVPVAAASKPPEENRTRRRMLALAALGVAAIAATYVVLRDDSDGVSTAAPEPPPAAAPAPAAAPVIGDWRGRVEVRYEDGTRDQLTQTLAIDAVEDGQVAGFSRSRQNGGSCWGPLRFTGMSGDAFTFAYRERNTDECIATGEVTMTPRGDATMDYREVTEISVNRGTVTRE